MIPTDCRVRLDRQGWRQITHQSAILLGVQLQADSDLAHLTIYRQPDDAVYSLLCQPYGGASFDMLVQLAKFPDGVLTHLHGKGAEALIFLAPARAERHKAVRSHLDGDEQLILANWLAGLDHRPTWAEQLAIAQELGRSVHTVHSWMTRTLGRKIVRSD